MKKQLILGALALSATAAMSATLTFNSRPVAGISYDISALGSVDWAYWNTTDNPATGAPTNEKAGGSAIGNIKGIGAATSVRGTSSKVDTDFTFTDGQTVASGTANNVSGLFNTVLNTEGTGAQLDIALPTAGQTYTVTIWTGAHETVAAAIVASLPGALNYEITTGGPGGNYGDSAKPKESYAYTFTVVADTAGAIFSFKIATAGFYEGTTGHVIITGAAVK